MADLSDVTAFLAQRIAGIVYPAGTAQPSVINGPVKVFEGWPTPDVLDLDMQGKVLGTGGVPQDSGVGPICSVSIYPTGASAQVPQVLDNPYVITPAQHALTAAIVGDAITISGTPGPGEFVTVIADSARIYSRGGATAADIVTALQADAVADYSGATAVGATLTLPGAGDLAVRIGAPATMGIITRRQKQPIQVTVWAPTPAARAGLAAAIDNALKQDLAITLPDTSQAIIRYERTMTVDDHQTVSIYRRDLIFSAEYATIETYTAYEITSVGTTIDPSALGGNPGAPALTVHS